jgi:bacterioferritin (cytochrome b1)
MGNKRTIKALEELVKTEHMAVGALDSALEEVDDNRLRKQYRKWRDAHMKQADALNDRLEELGGEPLVYEPGSKAQGRIWGKITSVRDDSSVAAMRVGAERGIKRYIDHLDEVDDAKALNIIRKNLEAKQDEIEWYDEQVNKERAEKLDTKLETTKEKAVEAEYTNGKKKGGFPLPLLIVAGAVGAAAYLLLRRSDEDEFDDYSEDAFRYETEDTGTESGYTSSGTYTTGGTDNMGGTTSMGGSTS